MSDRLRSLLGLLDDGKRIYHVHDGEVDREEFHYTTVMFNYLFDDQIGLIATLGPTWNMVNDPRFNKIENCFIYKRRAIFGGDTTVGQAHVSTKAREEKDSQSLEQYATIIGEGRYFVNVLLKNEFLDEEGDPCHPATFYQDSDALMWKLIRQECPNYFTREGKPNREATLLYNLFKTDLLGLVYDYAEVAQADEMINSESAEVFEEGKWDMETPIVNLEVDQIEKALSVRAHLRLTAYSILGRLGFEDKINDEQTRLTDWERDELLKLIYTSKWPDERTELAIRIMTFITEANKRPYEFRMREQLSIASEASKTMIEEIKTGARKVINRDTDPGVPVEDLDPEAALILGIQKNPYKRDLFTIYSWAETRALFGDEMCKQIMELLKPVFESTSYDINEEVFQRYIRQVRFLSGEGIFDAAGVDPEAERFKGVAPTRVVKGHCEVEVEPYFNEEIGRESKLCRKPLPCPIHNVN